jgi:isoleucyl-tRNA synthetase
MEEKKVQQKSERALAEEKVLNFWHEHAVFDKTLQKESPAGDFVFYEGPPTANAKPALHHLTARAFKDVIPRYKTMRGYRVRRRAGWDTHGLPVELQIEKKLGLTSKKDIETYGIAQFNKECKESVFTYIKDWETFTDRIGYWVDTEHAYYTFNTSYIESVWNILAQVQKRGLLYKDYKVVPWCPRCGTGLSSHELALGYQDVKDLSVYAKFKVKDEPNTYFLAWTTTPWTLPGNVALAVGAHMDYVKVRQGTDILILAKERLVLLEGEHDIVSEVKGSDLVGMAYEPLYPFLAELIPEKDKLEKAYRVYGADFVTTTDGTGIVHTAVMYGQDDFELGTVVGLPKFHTVNESGHFIPGTGFLEGKFVKDEGVAVDIIKDLAGRGLLFKKEKYEHSYPHCWRCKTPLIYYARDSWYIGMSRLRDDLVRENESINWQPEHIKEGRFGEWLREIKDWAISRERYWGTPLPIWTTPEGDVHIIDSVQSMQSYTKTSGNTYTVMRHGEALHNGTETVSCNIADNDPLTENGKAQAQQTAVQLADKHIDIIVASPFMRTKATAEILQAATGAEVVYDDRLVEVNAGEFEGKTWADYHQYMKMQTEEYWLIHAVPGGESLGDVRRRAGSLLYDLETKYQGKNILIITHGGVAWALFAVAGHASPDSHTPYAYNDGSSDIFVPGFRRFDAAEARELSFIPLPHNSDYELDLHRPYIDDIVLQTKDGTPLKRVKEVLDVWLDSGAMPFAQDHYPFEATAPAYPADYISEAIDQTRGWFYTLHAIGTLLGRGKAYKNVICLGHILDAQGKKMSKSIGNIVDPWEQMNTYGVDTLRLWMYSVNQPGDSKNYDEKTVMELQRQVFGLLYNVLTFYTLYRNPSEEVGEAVSTHVLDQWILARLAQLQTDITTHLDAYRVFEPVRLIRSFIDDLSTWYVRRSRDRMKDGDAMALRTLYRVLKTLTTLMAPFAPFAAEDIWQTLRHETDAESVHLASWPAANPVDTESVALMEQVREFCTVGNALRKKSGIPVRQPLKRLSVLSLSLPEAYLELVRDELNIKEVVQDETLQEAAVLDTALTDSLKREGEYRELVRGVQELRKKLGLTPSDRITLTISPDARALIEPFAADFAKTILADDVRYADCDGETLTLTEKTYSLIVEK